MGVSAILLRSRCGHAAKFYIYLMEYLQHLGKDKKLKKLIDTHEPIAISIQKNTVHYLVVSIMNQQLSARVAETIHQRFLALYEGRSPSAEEILATPVETLRSIGLSNAKVGYVHNVARFAIEEGMDHKKLNKMENEDVISYLTRIKGVGRWTVEMLLMFSLGREDVFAIDDWGVQKAMIGLYKLNPEDKKAYKEALIKISKKWSPYRTYACLHLWRWKDNTPVSTTKKK